MRKKSNIDAASNDADSIDDILQAGKYVIYTDGGAVNNPGPGGFGVVLRYGEHAKELSGGFRWTTNNRMELLACIEGLKALKLAVCRRDSIECVQVSQQQSFLTRHGR